MTCVAGDEERRRGEACDVVARAAGSIGRPPIRKCPTRDRSAPAHPPQQAFDTEAGIGGREGDTHGWCADGPERDAIGEGIDEHRRAAARRQIGSGNGPGLEADIERRGHGIGLLRGQQAGAVALVRVDAADEEHVHVRVGVEVAACFRAEEHSAQQRRLAGGNEAGDEAAHRLLLASIQGRDGSNHAAAGP